MEIGFVRSSKVESEFQNLERESKRERERLLKLLWEVKLGLGFRIGSYKLTWSFNLYPTFAFISAMFEVQVSN